MGEIIFLKVLIIFVLFVTLVAGGVVFLGVLLILKTLWDQVRGR